MSFGFVDWGGAPEGDRQLLEPRQILQVLQSENLQERWRGAVEQRPPETLAARDDFDQTALDQLVHHGVGIDAADFIDLEASHRLPIGDDRERFERRRRQATRPQRKLCALYGLGILTAGEELANLPQLHPPHALLVPRRPLKGGQGGTG